MKAAEPITAVPIGRRVHVMGNSCAGKSSLGAQLAQIMDVPFVDSDALNWEPDWVSVATTNPTEFEHRLRQATAGEGWVVAGSYTRFSQRTFWARLDTVIWLDLPMWQLVGRVLRRSWQRWRTKELLWGTNYERFWPQLMLWRRDESLLYWVVTQHRRKRQNMLSYMLDPQWQHIRFIRLTSAQEVAAFTQAMSRNYSAESDLSGRTAWKKA